MADATKFQLEIVQRLARIESKQDDLLTAYADQHECLHGNGKPGLVQEVHDIKADVRVIKQRHATEDVQTETIKTERRAFGWKAAATLLEKAVYIIGLAVALWLGLSQ